MSGHVFVSHAPGDSGYVQQLIFQLTAAGVPVWTGQQGSASDQIDTCAAFLPVLTPEAVASEQVQREIERARAAYRPVLSLLRAGAVPADLAGLPYEDVTGGQMPSPRLVEHLRGLTGAPPTFADAMAKGAPGTPRRKSRSRKLVVGIVAGVVALLVLCGLGVVAVVALVQSRATSVENAAVGDCLTGTTAEELDADKLTEVDCASAEALFKVVGRVEDKTHVEGDAVCTDAETDLVFWSGVEGGRGTVLCLQEL